MDNKTLKNKKILIGIPAFNEGPNIRSLINDLQKQKETGFIIEKIIVNSDGSDDDTVAQAQSLGDVRVEVWDNKDRKGQGERQNQILDYASENEFDAVVLINGDMRLKQKNFVADLIKPILGGKADLTSTRLLESLPTNLIEKVLASGNEIKRNVFEKPGHMDNWFNCHGAVRGLSPRFTKALRFKGSVSEDLYSYLLCIKNGYIFKFIPKLTCNYSIPGNVTDHLKQNLRFFKLPAYFNEEFTKEFIIANTRWPLGKIMIEGFKEFFRQPIYASLYVCLFVVNKILAGFSKNEQSNTWSIASTTRKVRV